jgi:hypothetical protein
MTKAIIFSGIVGLSLFSGAFAQAGVSLNCLRATAGNQLQSNEEGLFTWVRKGQGGLTVFIANIKGLTVLELPEGLAGGHLERRIRSKLFKGVYSLSITENEDGSFATSLMRLTSNALPWVKDPAMTARLDIVPLRLMFNQSTAPSNSAAKLLSDAIDEELLALAAEAGPVPLFEKESFAAEVSRSKELGTPFWVWARLVVLREDAAELERVRIEHNLSQEGFNALKAELEKKQASVVQKQSELSARGIWYFEAPTLKPETAARGAHLIKSCGDYVNTQGYAYARFKKEAHGLVNGIFMDSREQFDEATKGLDLNEYTASGIER